MQQSSRPDDAQPPAQDSDKVPSPACRSPNETARALPQSTGELPNDNVPTAATGDGDVSGVEDAPPSNRASETCNGDPSFQLLRQTIDSLEVSFRGEPRPEIWQQLH